MSLYKDASLVMIPSAVKDGKLYSMRPTDGDGDFTFSRGSNLAATRVDVNGLIEKGRENRLLYSQDYTQSSWNKSNCTITSNYIANPVDGSVNAPNITIDQTAGSYEKTMTQQNLTYVAGNVYCVSVWMKAGSVSSDTLKILAYDGGQIYSSPLIYLDDIANTPCKYEAGNDGWNRFYFYFKANNSGTGYIYIFNYAYGQVTNAGTNLYIYGAQWELGTYPTDYIKTGASTAQAGILEDLPRLDYSGGASCPALLLEPQRTNSVASSEYVVRNVLGWDINGDGGITTENNSTTSPEGLQNAVKLIYSGSGYSYARQSLTSGAGTISVYVKKGNWRYIGLRNGENQSTHSVFDFDTESFVLEKSGHTLGYESVGDGWYRIWDYQPTAVSPANGLRGVAMCDANGTENSPSTPADSYNYVWGFQVELGVSYPTSYIPTYGSAVTRSKDSCVSSSLTTSTDFTIFFEAPNFCLINGSTGGSYDSVQFLFSADGNPYSGNGSYHIYNNTLYYYNGSTAQGFGVIYNNQTDSKFVIMKRGDKALIFANGAKKTEATLPSGGNVSIWDTINLTQSLEDGQKDVFGSTYKQLLKFDTALTDSECIALTTL